MDLLQLQYFRTIARLENLTRAAEHLYVSQPNLSVSITRLEEDLGVALFDRRKGKITLTPNGRIFLEHVERVLDELDDGVELVRSKDRSSKNRIRVAGSIVDLISEMLLQYYPGHNDVAFKQVSCTNSLVPQKILADEADFGFVFGTPPSEGLEYSYMDSCERVAVLHREHPLASAGTIRLSQLAEEKIICNNSRDDAVFLGDAARLVGFRPRVFFECDDMNVETSLILAGRGISIAPLTNFLKLLREDPARPICCLRLREPLPKVQLGMVRRQGSILSPVALDFYRYVHNFFKEENRRTQSFLQNWPE